MEFIAHRINTVTELKIIPEDVGVELDLRDSLDGRIYIQHDPFKQGEDFEEYLREYRNGRMILNVKSERIEYQIIELLKKYGIKKYFFLDSSFPMIYSLSKEGCTDIAVRFSEYERMDTIRAMSGKVDWVWVDSFKRLLLDYDQFVELKRLGFKLCLVSPELQNRDPELEDYADYIKEHHIKFDAICTKQYNIERWKKSLSGQ